MGRGEHLGSVAQIARAGVAIAACLTLANCANKVDPRYGVSASPRVVEPAIPCQRAAAPIASASPMWSPADLCAGREHQLSRRRHRLLVRRRFPRPPDGERRSLRHAFDLRGASDAADAELCARDQFANRKSIVVRVNDRGPYADNRVIDLSVRAAKLLGFHDKGLGRVRVEYVGRAPMDRFRRPPARCDPA